MKENNMARSRRRREPLENLCTVLFIAMVIFSSLNSDTPSLLFSFLTALAAIPFAVISLLPSKKGLAEVKAVTVFSVVVIGVLPLILSSKLTILVHCIMMVALWAASLFFSITKRDVGFDRHIHTNLITYLVFILVIQFDRYTFFEGSIFSFLPVALAVGIVASAISELIRYNSQNKEKPHILMLILSTVVICFATFLLVTHANYALDLSEPQEERVVIVEKDRMRRKKGSDFYKFYFEKDGELHKIYISRYEYNSLDVGDEYDLLEYSGAFGKPFYVSAKYGK